MGQQVSIPPSHSVHFGGTFYITGHLCTCIPGSSQPLWPQETGRQAKAPVPASCAAGPEPGPGQAPSVLAELREQVAVQGEVAFQGSHPGFGFIGEDRPLHLNSSCFLGDSHVWRSEGTEP